MPLPGGHWHVQGLPNQVSKGPASMLTISSSNKSPFRLGRLCEISQISNHKQPGTSTADILAHVSFSLVKACKVDACVIDKQGLVLTCRRQEASVANDLSTFREQIPRILLRSDFFGSDFLSLTSV